MTKAFAFQLLDMSFVFRNAYTQGNRFQENPVQVIYEPQLITFTSISS